MERLNNEYFQGKTEATLESLNIKIDTIEKNIVDIKQTVEKLVYWKAKVSGMAIITSLLATTIWSLLLSKVRL